MVEKLSDKTDHNQARLRDPRDIKEEKREIKIATQNQASTRELESTTPTTPESEKALPTPEETQHRLLGRRLAEILRQHSAMESAIAPDHEYWQLKGLYNASPIYL